MKEKLEQIEKILSKMPWQSERGAKEIEKIVAELKTELEQKQKDVITERWKLAEEVTEKKVYKKLKYREVKRVYFRIRPIRENFEPCSECQLKLQKMLAEGSWILGNKSYEPAIELNAIGWDTDDHSFETIEEHQATPEEIERIGIDGWNHLGLLE